MPEKAALAATAHDAPFKLTQAQHRQAQMMAGDAQHVMAYGGSRCVSGDAILDGHSVTIAELAAQGEPVRVLTSRGWQWAEPPFQKGVTELWSVVLRCGRTVTVTDDHRFWSGSRWVRARDLVAGDALAVRTSAPSPRRSSSAACLSEWPAGDQRVDPRTRGGAASDVPARDGYELSKVCSITRAAVQPYYTLHVPGCEHYFANGILHHNSGKTFGFLRGIAARALMAPNSRHAAFRFRFNHIKASVISDTWPTMMRLCFPGYYDPKAMDKTDWFYRFPNGSEVWFAGLDDKDRTEKILGMEFATLFFNECSQIPWGSRNTALTRLAQRVAVVVEENGRRVEGGPLRLKAYYDCVSGDTVLPGYDEPISALAARGERVMALTTHGWREASAPWLNGVSSMLRVETTDGRALTVTPGHRFWTRRGWDRAGHLRVGDEVLCLPGEVYGERPSAPPFQGSSALREQDGSTPPGFRGPWSSALCVAVARDAFAIGRQWIWSKWCSLRSRGQCGPGPRGPSEAARLSLDTPLLAPCEMVAVKSMTKLPAVAHYTIEVPGCRHYVAGGMVSHNCNPPSKAHWTYKAFVLKISPEDRKPLADAHNYNVIQMNPHENVENLAPGYIEQVLGQMGARDRKRFLEGQFGEIGEGVLWPEELLDQQRVSGQLPDMQRIVIGVDPSGASGDEDKRSDEIGIIVVGLGTDGFGYVLEDLSIKAGPEVWGSIVVSAFERWDADLIVGETNYGGDMVAYVVRAADVDDITSFKKVTASRGKAVRAEPISTLFEKGKFWMAGRFHELEEQMMAMTVAGYTGDRSPDRLDALVWAATELFPSVSRGRRREVEPKVVTSRPQVRGVINRQRRR